MLQNLKHLPTTIPGLLLLVLSVCTQIPGFQEIARVTPLAASWITWASGIAGFLLTLGVGGKVDAGGAAKAILWLGILLCFVPSPARAETYFGVGAAYEQQTDTPVAALGVMARSLTDNLYSYSTVKITSLNYPWSAGNLPVFQYQFRTGILYHTFDVNAFRFFVIADPGVSSSSQNTNFSMGGGGGFLHRIKGNWSLSGVFRVDHDGAGGTRYSPEIIFLNGK